MIGGWLLYCLAVSVLLALAGATVDNMLTARGRPARWVWVAVMMGTLGMPATAYLLQQRSPRPIPGAGAVQSGSIIDRFPAWRLGAQHGVLAAARRVGIPRLHAPEFSRGDRLAVDVAILCIVLAGLRVAIDSVLLYRSGRRWTPDVVGGVPVLVSDDIGPAIVGLIEPKIVLPRWTLALDPDEQALMLVHEREHARTNDSRLTTVALLAVVCMPWNPVMWWALRRLRTAIEVDCDRRVLRVFPDVTRYGRLLVDVAQRAVGSSLAIAGFSERAAPLARRIQAMTTSVRARLTLRDASAGAFSALAVAGSVALLPPGAPARTLRAYAYAGPAVVLPKNVGDSIADGEERPVLVAAATDLPASFAVADVVGRDVLRGNGCAQRLRDERGGTSLLLSMSSTSTLGVVQRGDTAWTRIGSIGYYWVTPAGRYGVQQHQTLRVGCGSYTHATADGREITTSDAQSTLDSPHDDRAREIGRRMSAELRLEPAAIELFAGRLNVVVTDSMAESPGNEANWLIVHRMFAVSRAFLGTAAMPETLAVSLRTGRDRWQTLYWYKSMER